MIWRKILATVVLHLICGAVCLKAEPTFPLIDRHWEGHPDASFLVGEVLLVELDCVSCHQVPEQYELTSRSRDASGLAVSSRRWRPDYLLDYLANVTRVDPESRMPDMLYGQTPGQRRQTAAALRAFLRSGLVSPERERPEQSAAGSEERGRHLFESTGCLACHQNNESHERPLGVRPQRLTWNDLSEKYHLVGLADYLVDGTDGHGAGSAPGLPITDQEAIDIAAFLLRGRSVSTALDETDSTTLVEAGRQRFLSHGCVQCHSLPRARESSYGEGQPYPNLAEVSADGVGCLSSTGAVGRPLYRLSDDLRRQLQAAIARISHREVPDEMHLLARDFAQFRCFACHRREGQGGVTRDIETFFAAETDLGDEGRLPPDLTGVGRKLKQSALQTIIEGKLRSRPLMSARMPSFHERVARRMAARFAEVDIPDTERPTVREVAENQVGRNMWGRALLGTSGLACISCHALGGHRSLGVQAMDLALSPLRLRPEWFRDYLLHPASFRPGTRMPAFWPEGKPSLPGFGGSAARQIDSIWAYLNELDQSRLPIGLVDERELLLEPKERPIVFRTFMKDVGNHAIAVGFASELHAAFDARDMRWVLGWKGAFLDAESTWHDRFTPPATPEGHDVVMIQGLPRADRSDRAFNGYHLDPETGVPTFSYRYGPARVFDTMTATNEGEGELRRTISIQGDESEVVWMEIASGAVVEPKGKGWQVGERLYVECSGDTASLRLIQSTRLQARLQNKGESDSFEVIYRW